MQSSDQVRLLQRSDNRLASTDGLRTRPAVMVGAHGVRPVWLAQAVPCHRIRSDLFQPFHIEHKDHGAADSYLHRIHSRSTVAGDGQ